jgi:AcrR family transcriptional regulator
VAAEEATTITRTPLTKERVLAAALAIADRDGLDALSMRAVARSLGAGAMSLYHHVADKDALLDELVDLVFAEIALPPRGVDWRAAQRHRMRSAQEALRRHPWAIALMESRASPGPANLRAREATLAVLRDAGFSIVTATHALWVLDSYLYGYALQLATLPFDGVESLAAMTEDVFLPQLDAATHPYLHEAARTLMATGYDPAAEFDVGLEVVLDAVDALRAR